MVSPASLEDVVNADGEVLVSVGVHFDDLDSLGMLHNSRYATLAERAWVEYWQRHGIGVDADGGLLEDGYNVVKELLVTFDRSIHRPGRYAAALSLEKIGRSSLTYRFRICSAEGDVTYAHGKRTIIRVDQHTLRPTEWTAAARDLVSRLQPAA
ncbi:acyl-CoA thioesterase [Actinoplanes sp. NPDC051859]|uniref:acyl-CoA thioesterase n=1 Tax=Actinoplanes sp. NPDC051859 TaxID=3363909 RepID=UPI0037B2A044